MMVLARHAAAKRRRGGEESEGNVIREAPHGASSTEWD